MKRDFTQFVHEFKTNAGDTRWAVAEWLPETGSYTCPLDIRTAKLTGCHTEYARNLNDLGGYKTRKQALARARYLFGDDELD